LAVNLSVSGISGGILFRVATRALSKPKLDWREGRFAQVPQETEFIPLPEEPPFKAEQPL
jgi:hypothetical protein